MSSTCIATRHLKKSTLDTRTGYTFQMEGWYRLLSRFPRGRWRTVCCFPVIRQQTMQKGRICLQAGSAGAVLTMSKNHVCLGGLIRKIWLCMHPVDCSFVYFSNILEWLTAAGLHPELGTLNVMVLAKAEWGPAGIGTCRNAIMRCKRDAENGVRKELVLAMVLLPCLHTKTWWCSESFMAEWSNNTCTCMRTAADWEIILVFARCRFQEFRSSHTQLPFGLGRAVRV